MIGKQSRALRSLRTRVMLFLGDLNISKVYEMIERAFPDDVLLRLQSPLDFRDFDGPNLTGRQIRDLGYKITNALMQEGPPQPNTRVIVVKRNHPDYLLYLLSTICAGGIPVSVNRGAGWAFVRRVQRVTGARTVLTDAETLNLAQPDELDDLLARDVRLDVVSRAFPESLRQRQHGDRIHHLFPLIEAAPAVSPPPRTLGDDTPVALFHTSGTTGMPKVCIWNRKNVTRIWRLMLLLLPLTGNSRGMIACPCSHALFFALQVAGLLMGVWTYAMSKFDPKECLATIERYRITHYMGFPYTYMRIAAEDLSAYDLSSMTLWSTGADSAHAAHIAKVIRVGTLRLGPFKIRGSMFVDSYGSTEIGAGGILQIWWPWSNPVPCLQGRPLPTQFACRIVDGQWRSLRQDHVGRILVRSTPHFAGYWNNHSVWAQSRIDGWWWAGDIGKVDHTGRLYLLDREVDSVHTATGVMYTLPVEERLLMHGRVMETAVVQRTTDSARGLGEAVAYVVPKGYFTRADMLPEPEESLQERLLAFANAERENNSRLSEVRILPLVELPLGVTGKVLKRRLRKLVNEGAAAVKIPAKV